MAEFTIEKRDLDVRPRFWVTFDEAAATEHNTDLPTGAGIPPFELELLYHSEAAYDQVEKSSRDKKQMRRGEAAEFNFARLCEKLPGKVVLDWHMPMMLFLLRVPLDPEVVARMTNGKAVADEDTVGFSPEACAAFLKADSAYVAFVRESSRKANLAYTQTEDAAEKNSPASLADSMDRSE